jgi:hypothetical protein
MSGIDQGTCVRHPVCLPPPGVGEWDAASKREEGWFPIATQTETQRKAAAQKAAATRRQNAARRSRSAKKAAETRARGQLNTLQALGLQAQRIADTAVGATLTAGENVAEALKPVASRRETQRELKRLRGRLTTNLRKVERRGATARKRAQRSVSRQRAQAVRALRRNGQQAERQVKSQAQSTRDGVERRFGEAQTTSEDVLRRVQSEARNLA